MTRLNATTAAEVTTPGYDVESSGVGIVHIGPGAFFRAHQAVFTEDALAHGGDWRICGVQMRSTDVRDALAPQDYRYTLAVLDETSNTRVIHALAEVLVVSEELETVLSRLSSPSTHIVTLTITEKGYCLLPSGELDLQNPEIISDLSQPKTPCSAIGLIAEALRRRRNVGATGLTIMSCDNLAGNGKLLGGAVHSFVKAFDETLSEWIDQNVAFPCTMVDSITPATDRKLIERVSSETGVHDAMPVCRERFCQWVIEDRFSGPRPAWDLVGATYTKDIALFVAAKIRLLNGAHSTLSYAGMLAGHETVRQAVLDESLKDFVREMMIAEVCPTLRDSSELDLLAYVDDILQRFHNPEIAYFLSQIAGDGSQKVRIRLLATIEDCIEDARPCDRLIYAVSAWLQYVRRSYSKGLQIKDPLQSALTSLASRCNGDGQHDVSLFMENDMFFSDALKCNDVFINRLISSYEHISAGGLHHNLQLMNE